MITKLVLAVVIAIVTGLVLVSLVGPLLVGTHAPVAVTVGDFFIRFGWVLAILAGIWYFFAGARYRRHAL